MHSMPIISNIFEFASILGEEYSIQGYVIRFVSDIQVSHQYNYIWYKHILLV